MNRTIYFMGGLPHQEAEAHMAYAIELAKRITNKCVRARVLTSDEGNLVFDTLVDGFKLRSSNELAQMILDIGGNYNDND